MDPCTRTEMLKHLQFAGLRFTAEQEQLMHLVKYMPVIVPYEAKDGLLDEFTDHGGAATIIEYPFSRTGIRTKAQRNSAMQQKSER